MFPETSLHPESSSGDKKERVDVVEILNALSVTARAGRRERDGSYAVRARSADVCLDNDGPFIDGAVRGQDPHEPCPRTSEAGRYSALRNATRSAFS